MTEQSLASEEGPQPAAHPARAPFGGVGGPAPSSWREQALTRIAEVEEQAAWMRARAKSPPAWHEDLYAAIARHVDAARAAAAGSHRRPLRRFARWLTGSPLERAANCRLPAPHLAFHRDEMIVV